MERVTKAMQMDGEQFKRIIGVTKPVFTLMLDILQTAYNQLHQSGGKPPSLSVGDKLLITLQYYREYRTMEHIAVDYGCSKSSVHRSVVWAENTLSADQRFTLPGKAKLPSDASVSAAVDVTEHPIERPKKTRRLVFRQEKAAHVEIANHCRA
jgi:hypothetical protein